MYDRVNPEQLTQHLSRLFSAPGSSRPGAVMKEQCRQLLRNELNAFCLQELFAQSRVWLELHRHTGEAFEELSAGQSRCALELGLFLWELTRLLADACLNPLPDFPFLLSQQGRLLQEASLAQNLDRAQFERDISRLGYSDSTKNCRSVSSSESPEQKLYAGDDSFLHYVKAGPCGPMLVFAGREQPLSPNQAPSPWAYARVLLLTGQKDSLYDFLLQQPQLLAKFEGYFFLFSPAQALSLRLEELRMLTASARTTTEYAHICNGLLDWLNGEHRNHAVSLIPELMELTRRSELKTILGRLERYGQSLSGRQEEACPL